MLTGLKSLRQLFYILNSSVVKTFFEPHLNPRGSELESYSSLHIDLDLFLHFLGYQVSNLRPAGQIRPIGAISVALHGPPACYCLYLEILHMRKTLKGKKTPSLQMICLIFFIL